MQVTQTLGVFMHFDQNKKEIKIKERKHVTTSKFSKKYPNVFPFAVRATLKLLFTFTFSFFGERLPFN